MIWPDVYVAPKRMAGNQGKNDANDAQAICEAVARPNMRFVPVKTINQQAELFHRPRHSGYRLRVSASHGTLSAIGRRH